MSLPAAHPLACTGCKELLPVPEHNQEEAVVCPECSHRVIRCVFPRLTDPPAGATGLAGREAGEASCFFDPSKPAEYVCDDCGCLMNSLYEFSVGDRHYCVSCIERLRKSDSPLLISRKNRYDLLAYYLTIIGFIIFYFSIITAPLALIIAVMQFKKPQSVAPHSRAHFIVAITLSLLQMAGWAAFFGFLYYSTIGGS